MRKIFWAAATLAAGGVLDFFAALDDAFAGLREVVLLELRLGERLRAVRVVAMFDSDHFLMCHAEYPNGESCTRNAA